MKSALRLTCLCALPLALAACKGENKTAQKGTAAGEILEGSTSDAMLPYDTLRSQPPLAPLPTATGKAGAKTPEDEESEAAASASEAAAATSAAPATPQATATGA